MLHVTYIQEGKYLLIPLNSMETTLFELKEILLTLKEEMNEIKQEIGKIKIELATIEINKKKNKRVEKFDILRSEIIGTSFKKPTVKPQTGSYDDWFIKTQYPKILEETEKLKAELKIKEKGKEKLEIKQATPSDSE